MTVCIAVAVNDCLVFAADSASSLVQTDPNTGESTIFNVYQHGDKVFNLHKELPISAMTCGMGNIGQESIATIAKDLRSRLTSGGGEWKIDPQNYTIEDVAIRARRILFEERYAAVNPAPAAPHSLEFWVGGYGSDRSSGHEVRKVKILNGACDAPQLALDPGGSGLLVGGQPSPVLRLITGVDPVGLQALLKAGVPQAEAEAVMGLLAQSLNAPIIMPTMPVRDAIDLADFLVDVTKKYFRFLPGADIVGGDADVAVVTRYEGFKWIRRKHFYPSHLNPLVTGHA